MATDFLATQTSTLSALGELRSQMETAYTTSQISALSLIHDQHLRTSEATATAVADEVERVRREEEAQRQGEFESALTDARQASEKLATEKDAQIADLKKQLKKTEEEKKRMKIKFDQDMYVLRKTKT